MGGGGGGECQLLPGLSTHLMPECDLRFGDRIFTAAICCAAGSAGSSSSRSSRPLWQQPRQSPLVVRAHPPILGPCGAPDRCWRAWYQSTANPGAPLTRMPFALRAPWIEIGAEGAAAVQVWWQAQQEAQQDRLYAVFLHVD